MSSDDLFRQVPDELFRKVSKRPERGLPDALFGPPTVPGSVDAVAHGAESLAEEAAPGDSESSAVAHAAEAVDEVADEVIVDEALLDAALESELSDPTLDVAEAVVAEESEAKTPDISPVDAAVSAEETVPAAESTTDHATDTGGEFVCADPEAAGVADAAVDEAEPAVAGETTLAAHTDAVAADPAAEPETSSEPRRRPVLLVIADSLAYFGPEGGLPADDPRIWPNLVAAELDWDVELIGRIGWTCRDAYWALIGDPRVWSSVPHAGAVVFAVGGMDTLPSPLPTALRELIRYLRPPGLRRRVRDTYQWLQPKLAKLGRPVALPPKVSVDYLEQSRAALAQLRAELPVVAVLPSVHNCDAYGRVHRGREPAVRALREWSERTSVPLVDLGEAVRDNIFSGEANPDGIHWGWDGHTAVANAMTKTLYEAG